MNNYTGITIVYSAANGHHPDFVEDVNEGIVTFVPSHNNLSEAQSSPPSYFSPALNISTIPVPSHGSLSLLQPIRSSDLSSPLVSVPSHSILSLPHSSLSPDQRSVC